MMTFALGGTVLVALMVVIGVLYIHNRVKNSRETQLEDPQL